jgi:hypothetical protein
VEGCVVDVEVVKIGKVNGVEDEDEDKGATVLLLA